MSAFVIGINPPDRIGAVTREDLGLAPYQPHVVLASYEGDDAEMMADSHRANLARGRAAEFYDGFLVAVTSRSGTNR
jgi:hypothetical protein